MSVDTRYFSTWHLAINAGTKYLTLGTKISSFTTQLVLGCAAQSDFFYQANLFFVFTTQLVLGCAAHEADDVSQVLSSLALLVQLYKC